jgi:hypothetical protein
VLAGRPAGRTPVAFTAGIAATAACALVVLGIDAGQSSAAGRGDAPFAPALALALLPVPLLVTVVLWMDRRGGPAAGSAFTVPGGPPWPGRDRMGG